MIFPPNQQPELLQDDKRLPVLAGIDLELTVTKVFDWLKMSN
ncbi:hypothetical protein [Trichormus azollae]